MTHSSSHQTKEGFLRITCKARWWCFSKRRERERGERGTIIHANYAVKVKMVYGRFRLFKSETGWLPCSGWGGEERVSTRRREEEEEEEGVRKGGRREEVINNS